MPALVAALEEAGSWLEAAAEGGAARRYSAAGERLMRRVLWVLEQLPAVVWLRH
jgi:hypothetical protein